METLDQSSCGLFQADTVQFHCSPATCFERPNQGEIMDQSLFVAGVGLNGTSMAECRNGHHGNALRCGKKHKRVHQDEGDDPPVRKRRLTKATCVLLIPTVDAWGHCTSGHVVNGISPCTGGNISTTSLLDSPCEEMEQTIWEQQSEHAKSSLQEIEDRLTDEEEVETEYCINNLPRLVFSETLKAELKRESDALTKKIAGSFTCGNRENTILSCMRYGGMNPNKQNKFSGGSYERSPPSMELVLWKPPPAFDADKQKTSKEFEQAAENFTPRPATMGTVFLQQTETLAKGENRVSPNLTYSNLASAWYADEEMEL